MWRTIEFYDQLQRRAVEIHDETVQHVLAAKLQAEQASVPQQRPYVSLGRRWLAAQLAREREFLLDTDGTQGIHVTR
jgi:hypothetical protein